MDESYPGQDRAEAAKRLCREAGIGTSDCRVIQVGPISGPERGWIELRPAFGTKRLAVIATLLDGTPVAIV